MAVNDVYRLSVDYTLATQVTSPVSGKTCFIPTFQLGSAAGASLIGRKVAAQSLPTAEAGMPYETVAAGQTDQVLGTTGAAGDYLSHIIIQPATTGAGTCVVKDGAGTIYTFTTGTLTDLSPKVVPFGIFSTGALSVTTGANVAILAVGNFT